MTLRGNNDFKLEDFFAGPSEMFEPHYGKIACESYFVEVGVNFVRLIL